MRFFLALAALCVPAASAGACAVDQVRLALAATPESMTVVWATGNVSTPPGYSGVVIYGTSPTSLTSTSAPGDSRNYTIDKQGSPFLHMAQVTGLTPGSRYYYQIVAAAGSPACAPSAVLNFTSAPAVGDARAYPIRVASYGDMGITNSRPTAAFLAELAAAGSVDLIIHAGDISYADNRGATDRNGGYENVQNTYYNEVSPYQSLVPAMYSSGNHEAYSGSAPAFLAYRTRVAPTMPGTAASGSPFWHSFNYGRVHFIAFDIDQPWAAGSAQHSWIVGDLAAVDRSTTPIVFAFNHFPLLCSNKFWCEDGSGEAQRFRALYEPIFNAAATRAHIFLSGHVHAAEIMYPLATNGSVPTQTTFSNLDTVLQVMAGFPGDEEVCCNDWQRPPPAWSAWRLDDVDSDGGTFGFALWEFKSDTSAQLQMWNSENRTLLTQIDISFA